MIRVTFMLMAILATLASSGNDATVAFTLFSDGSTNSWTQADLKAALQLTNRKYHRDMQKPQGRIDWHGPVVRRVVETNDLRMIEYHEDGYTHTNRWRLRPQVLPADRARMIQEQRNARISYAKRFAAYTNGVPKVIVDARRAAVASAMVVETNIVVEANR